MDVMLVGCSAVVSAASTAGLTVLCLVVTMVASTVEMKAE